MIFGSRKWSWDNLIDQIKNNCDISDKCWIWQGGTDKDGYPKLYIDGKHWRGNRAVLYSVTGKLEEHAMHSCDTPKCCNPKHLSWGSASDNAKDAVTKGRRSTNFRGMLGDMNGRAKLTNEQKTEIIALSSSTRSTQEVADTYGISIKRVQAIWLEAEVSRPRGGYRG